MCAIKPSPYGGTLGNGFYLLMDKKQMPFLGGAQWRRWNKINPN